MTRRSKANLGKILIQAVLSVVIAAALACPALAAQPEKVTVRKAWPLFYGHLPDGKPFGQARQMLVRVSPSKAGGLRLGFFESAYFGTGSQWRAAGWMAGVVSALESGIPMSRWRISFDVPGRIDGPSAGGLMTAALLSAFYGQDLLPDATMTGTINPDGSIGPVSGIYHKLAGASQKGMKKVLIPAGLRMEKQPDGSVKDLYQRGRQLGLEVREVADVQEAYEQLTGRFLPRVKDHGKELKIPPKARKALEQTFLRWQGKFKDATGRMTQTASQVPKQYHPKLDIIWKGAHQLHSLALAARKMGNICAAAPLMFLAAVGADSGAHLSYLYIALEQGGKNGLLKVLRGYLIQQSFLDSFRRKLNAKPIKNLNELLALTEAYAYYGAAVGTHLYSSNLLKAADKLKNVPAMRIVETVTVGEALARNFFYYVDDLLLLGYGHQAPALSNLAGLIQWAKGMHLGAGANLGYIDRAIILPIAQRAKKDPGLVKQRIVGNDQQFQLANLCYQAVPIILGHAQPGPHQAAAILGAATASFAMSSLTVAKYYSLEAIPDKSGAVARIGRPKILKIMQQTSRKRLRQIILKCRKKGFQPIIPLYHYRAAEGLLALSQDPNDRLAALSEYWLAATLGSLVLGLDR
jgi:uncharacterized protein